MNNKDKGNIGESRVITFALQRGYDVLIPFGDNLKYDIVIDRNGKFERIQVKYCRSNKSFIKIGTRYCTGYKPKVGKYTKDMIDWIAGYDVNTDICYFVPAEILGKGRNSIRLFFDSNKVLKNGKHILYAKDFLDL